MRHRLKRLVRQCKAHFLPAFWLTLCSYIGQMNSNDWLRVPNRCLWRRLLSFHPWKARMWSISGECLQIFSGHQKRLHSADYCRWENAPCEKTGVAHRKLQSLRMHESTYWFPVTRVLPLELLSNVQLLFAGTHSQDRSRIPETVIACDWIRSCWFLIFRWHKEYFLHINSLHVIFKIQNDKCICIQYTSVLRNTYDMIVRVFLSFGSLAVKRPQKPINLVRHGGSHALQPSDFSSETWFMLTLTQSFSDVFIYVLDFGAEY